MKRLVPHPLISIALAGAWLALGGSASAAQALSAIVLAVAIPHVARVVSPPVPCRVRRPATILRLALTVLRDIVSSNVEVARRVLGPESAIRPATLRVPLVLTDTQAIATLAGIVTMTPGTLSAEVDDDRGHLVVHAFHVDDADALVASIKSRYEAPLKEIYE